MLHDFFKNKFELHRLIGLENNINYFNWSFLNDKAVVRQEHNTWIYHKSSLVEFKFNREKITFSDPKVLYTDDIISYEDPRIINDTDISYIKVDRPINEFDKLPRASNFKIKLMYNDIDCNKKFNKENSYEKNWQFSDLNNFIYSINPFIIFKNGKYINKGTFNLKEFKYGEQDYSLSTNKFIIENREFIFFHTKDYVNRNFIRYWQGVIELKDNRIISYCKKPFFYPSDYLSDKNKLCQLFRFREISESILYRYQLGYFSTARVENNNINISCGLNECESVLISVPCNKFIEWYDTFLELI